MPKQTRLSNLGPSLNRHAMLLWGYFTQYVKVQIGYRADFLISLGTSFAATVFQLGFVLILFQRIPRLAGWTFPEVLFLYGFSLIPYGLFNVISLNLYNFGNNYIIEGKFDRVLLRPVSSLFQVLFEQFRIEAIQEVATGIFCVAWAARKLRIAWTADKIVLLLFFGLCAGLIYLSVFLILTSVSFWFEDRIGVSPPVWNVIAFGRYPLSIYSAGVQFVLCWVIPFGLASFYPSVRLLGRAVTPEYAPLVPVVAASFFTLAVSLWNFGTRHYASTGS